MAKNKIKLLKNELFLLLFARKEKERQQKNNDFINVILNIHVYLSWILYVIFISRIYTLLYIYAASFIREFKIFNPPKYTNSKRYLRTDVKEGNGSKETPFQLASCFFYHFQDFRAD